MRALALLLALMGIATHAGQPQLKSLKVTWDPYSPQPGCSNVVIVIYKQTSLGTVFTPWKPTAYVPATRTNVTITVLPGLYHFRATAQGQPLPESEPSNTVTNLVSP